MERQSIKSVLLAFGFVMCGFVMQAQNIEVLLNESFEMKSTPEGWKEEMNGPNRGWGFYRVGTVKPFGTEDLPLGAVHGEWYAYYYYESPGFNSRLITPFINLEGRKKPVLSFSYCAPEFLASMPFKFRVEYRTDPKGSWTELRTYQEESVNWKKEELLLPSQRIQLAFWVESVDNAGGLALDNVRVENRDLKPRKLTQVNLWNVDGGFPTKIKSEPIAGVRLMVDGNNEGLELQSVQFEYSGDDIGDIERFSLFYTRDSIFLPEKCIAASANILSQNIVFSGLTQQLDMGKNFIWLCGDVKEGAQHGHRVGVNLPAGGIKAKSEKAATATVLPLQAQVQAGKGRIEESLLTTGFEQGLPEGWSVRGVRLGDNTVVTSDWEVGVPGGGGGNAPKKAYEGNQILATRLNGNYTNDIVHSVTVPKTDVTYYKDVKLSFVNQLNLVFGDNAMVVSPDIRNAYGTLGDTIFSVNSASDSRWNRLVRPLERAERSKEKVGFTLQLASAPNSSASPPDGWSIDNFALTGNRIDYDLGVVRIGDFDKCGLAKVGNLTPISVWVRNYGYNDVNSVKLGFSLDNGRTWTYQTFSQTLKSPRNTSNEAEIEKEFIFDPVQFTHGQKQIIVKVFLDDDEDDTNDAQRLNLFVFPSLSGQSDYLANFATTNGNMYTSGTRSSWVFGVDTLIMGKRASGWTTRANGYYNNSEDSYLETPCYDLTGMQYPVFSFTYALHLKDGDMLKVQYSSDDGETWQDLKLRTMYNQNWQNDGWTSANNTNVETTAHTVLKENEGTIKFRFKFVSNAQDTSLGVLITSMNISPLPYNIKATILSPKSGCNIGVQPISFEIKNVGYRTIKQGLRIPTFIRIDGGTNFDTLVISEDIGRNGVLVVNSLKSYDFSKKNKYTLGAQIRIQPGWNGFVDIAAKDIEEFGNPRFTLGSDIGTSDPSKLGSQLAVVASDFPYTNATSYSWSKRTYRTGSEPSNLDDPDTWPGDWVAIGSGNNQLPTGAFASDEFGIIRVCVANSKGCKDTAFVRVLNSNQDIGIDANDISVNIAESSYISCFHDEEVVVTAQVSYFAGDPFASVDVIPIGLEVNGEEVALEYFTLTDEWKAGSKENKITHAFKSIDLSARGEYKIRVYTLLASDIDRTNDSSKVITIVTHGRPGVEIQANGMAVADTVTASPAKGIQLQAITSSTYSPTYRWDVSVDGNSWIPGGTESIYVIPDNRSVYYRATVEDSYQCGESVASVYVSTKDIGVYYVSTTDIDPQKQMLPKDTVCYSESGSIIRAIIRNYSDDTYPVGSTFDVVAETPSGRQEQVVTLGQELLGMGDVYVEFPQPVYLEEGETRVEVAVQVAGDVSVLNDRYSKEVLTIPPPTVSMPIDTLIMGFTENTVHTIMPTTSLNVISYQWSDENGNPVVDATGVSTNRDFNIKGLPLKKYVLTVSNGFCEASDSIVIISQDISIAILSPEDTCAWRMAGNVYPVKVQIINSGSDLEAGISVRLLGEADIDGAKTSLAHTVNFSEPFLSGEVKEVTMPQMLRLRGADFVQVSLTAFPEGFDDADESNNSALHSAFALGFPSVDFMPAPYTSILDNNITLNVVGRWMDYYWYLASDNLSKEDKWIGPAEKAIGRDSALVVGDTLKQATIAIYATNYGGCSGTRTQEVFFHTHDLAITQLIEPISACSMPDKSVVKVRVENVGDYTMNKLDTILLSVRVGTGDWIVDTMVIDSDNGFAPGQHIDFAFGTSNPGVYSSIAKKSKTIDLSIPNDYTITTRLKTAYDRQPDNDEREDLVMHYQPINLSWPDRHNGCKGTEYTYDVEADASGLYTNLGTPTYLWSTGARTAKVTLTEGSDIFQDKEVEYTVNIVNGVGCSRSTSFKITYLALPEASIIDVNGDPMNGPVDICAGDQLYIGSGSAHEYLWNTGATTANIFATESGSYIVTVKNVSGCTNSDSVRVVKHELPYIHMGEVTALCDGNALPLDAGDAAEYVWILPSGAPVYERNVVATEAGMYIANIKDHFGCQNADTVNLEVIPSPTDVKILNATDLTECPGVEVYLNVTSKGGTRYKWSTGEVSQNINVKSDTDQSYTVTVGNDHGCTQSASINVKRYPAEKVRIETVCKDNDKYGLKVYNVANKYEWSGMSQTGAEIEAEKGRTYSVTITDGNNCKHTGSAMVQNPSVSISLGAPLCEGGSTQLKSSITDAKSYTWTGVEASGASATINNGGTYGLSVVTRDNCTSTPASITVDVRPAPKPTISVSGGQMTVGGGTFSSVVWNTGETTPSIRVSKVGTYTVTVTNADGCKAEASSTYTWLAPVAESLEANVVAYPNPTSNQLNVRIEASQAAAYTLTLYSSIGEAVWTRIVQVDAIHEEVIDVQHLPAGFYLLRVSEGQRATVLKIAVE